MKKKMLFIIMALFTLIVGVNNVDAYTGSSGIDYSSCIAFADGFKIISNAQGSYEYKYCYRASCQGSVWSKADMTAINGFQCQNGNGTPYRQVTSDGCSKYTGTCNTVNQAYCTKVEYVDCNRKADGSSYGVATQRPTTQGVIVPPTTLKPTTKRTTTKANPNTQKTTFPTIPVESATTKPTTAAVTNNTNIKKITVNDTDIKYKSTKDSYTIKLLYDIQDVDVKVELEDETSTVQVTGNTGMPNEDHEIKIVVTAVSGDTKEVTLKVKRYTNLSNDCTLANIYTEDYSIDFSKNTYSYKLKLPKSVSSLDLEVIPTEESSTFSIDGNEKLKNNSVIKIDVRAEDGTTCEYSIKIKKSSNTWKYILAIVLLVGVLVVSSVLLYRYLKKSKGKYKYE